jgi:hypothetical protein
MCNIVMIRNDRSVLTYSEANRHAGCATELLVQDFLNVPQQQQDGYAGQVIRDVQL